MVLQFISLALKAGPLTDGTEGDGDPSCCPRSLFHVSTVLNKVVCLSDVNALLYSAGDLRVSAREDWWRERAPLSQQTTMRGVTVAVVPFSRSPPIL